MASTYSEVDMNENIQEALELWIDSGMAEPGRFEDAYQGYWSSFGEYLAEEIKYMQRDWPEEAVRYFDWDLYECDQLHSYTVCDAPNGGVYVFLDL
ncbi:antirestriction protein ArdA [Schaalia turicensis]|nr:antirestriction protein ArdA [Schaalia turicensis]